MWDKITAHISEVTRDRFVMDDRRSVGGGCINQGYKISGGFRHYFVKLNRAIDIAMFEAEAKGLQQMFETQTILVPKPICSGTAYNSAYLVLEWLDLGGRGGNQAWEEMGRKLAAMHRFHPLIKGEKGQFGWDINNTIGSTPQINNWTKDWVEFWRDHRIGYQLKLGRRKGGYFPNGEKLLEKIPELLAGYDPQPSLVHGDLWGGNASVTSDGKPVIFDPATYFADREVDIAMTELFGGFSSAFYQGYNKEWPLEEGYEQRKTLYNLYHILNHFNLFGGSYENQANQMINRLLK
jgi:fructosamine-3-kinase